MTRFISFQDADPLLEWIPLTRALADGHTKPKAEIGDTFLSRAPDTLLSRAAWIDGMGALVKTATVFPENPSRNLPTIHGGVCLFSDLNGQLDAVMDFHLLTKWKTAGDSLLAALRLAPEGAKEILILGAGTVAASMIDAYRAGFPDARIRIWNRSPDKAEALATRHANVEVAYALPDAVGEADIICGATMSQDPVLKGAWLTPDTHIDLIGAYKADMREADDDVLKRARLFLDSRDTVIGHIGEYTIPLQQGVIQTSDIEADYYELGAFVRSAGDITLCKNGGGAHLDLMTARYILETVPG